MNDYLRESFSYFGLFKKMAKVKKEIVPESVQFGEDKNQYFLYYEPKSISPKEIKEKIIQMAKETFSQYE